MSFEIPNLSYFKIEESMNAYSAPIIKRLWKSWGSEKDLGDTSQYEQALPLPLKELLPQVNVLDPKGRLFMGSFPGDRHENIAKTKLKHIQEDLGVCTYINLLTENERTKFNPYCNLAYELGAMNFLYFPIPDMGIADDETLLDFLEKDLLPVLENTQTEQKANFYLHCWGGHGRTGIIAGILIGILYGLSGDEALSHIERVHAMRINYHLFDLDGNKVPYLCPQTDPQRNQVRRILETISKRIK